MTRRLRSPVLALLFLMLLAPAGWAHHGPPHDEVDEFDDAPFARGLVHPVSGWNHLLTAVAAGALVWRFRGMGGPAAGACFVAGVATGVLTGLPGLTIPAAALVIFAGTCVCAGALLSGWNVPPGLLAVALACLGAVHGAAHRIGAPGTAPSVEYAAGLCLTSIGIMAVAAACTAAGTRLAAGRSAVAAGT